MRLSLLIFNFSRRPSCAFAVFLFNQIAINRRISINHRHICNQTSLSIGLLSFDNLIDREDLYLIENIDSWRLERASSSPFYSLNKLSCFMFYCQLKRII